MAYIKIGIDYNHRIYPMYNDLVKKLIVVSNSLHTNKDQWYGPIVGID